MKKRFSSFWSWKTILTILFWGLPSFCSPLTNIETVLTSLQVDTHPGKGKWSFGRKFRFEISKGNGLFTLGILEPSSARVTAQTLHLLIGERSEGKNLVNSFFSILFNNELHQLKSADVFFPTTDNPMNFPCVIVSSLLSLEWNEILGLHPLEHFMSGDRGQLHFEIPKISRQTTLKMGAVPLDVAVRTIKVSFDVFLQGTLSEVSTDLEGSLELPLFTPTKESSKEWNSLVVNTLLSRKRMP